MPIIQSAKKRVRQAGKATARNVKTKRSFKSAIKALNASLKGGKKNVDQELKDAQSALDVAVKKNVISKNKAARKKAALARAAKAAGASAPKKDASKKPATKKAPAKKPTAKKAPSKKTAAKKPAKK